MREPNTHVIPATSQHSQENSLHSRRIFLKAVGATVLGSVAATVPIPSFVSQVAAVPESRRRAQEIASSAPLFRYVLGILQAHHFTFDASVDSFNYASEQERYAGLTLHHRETRSRRTGADLVLTVDMQSSILISVQYIIGWCLDCSLEVQSTVWDVRLELPRQGYGRKPTPKPEDVTWPQQDQHWTLRRAPKEVTQSGTSLADDWPSDPPEACHWFYLGQHTTDWVTTNGQLSYRCTQVVEERSCQPEQKRTLALV